jgi:hypothetical protein
MARPPIDLGSGGALLDLRSFGRAARVTPTKRQARTIAYTVRRAPELMVKVSGGARSLSGVQAHFAYIGRDGTLDVEVDRVSSLWARDSRSSSCRIGTSICWPIGARMSAPF